LSDVSFNGVAIVAAVALGAPLALGLFPKLRLPAIVLEIVLGIAIGPQVLGWVSIDTPIQVLSLLGLAFLLLLAGLEVEYDRFRGRPLRLTALGYAISFGLALVIGLGLSAGGLVKSPLLVAIVLSATSLGIVIPVLKDADQVSTQFGQLVVAGASIAEISEETSSVGVRLVLLGLFGLFVVAVGVAVLGAEHSLRISATRCGFRTQRRRSAYARRSCCSRSSSCSPSGSNSRRFLARSLRAQSSRSSTGTKR
jgi:predicted Kef-type K+ transport protein